MPKLIDMTGRRYGKLVVVAFSHATPNKQNHYWMCRCECGVEKLVLGKSLRTGHTESCGCQQRLRTHGLSRRSPGTAYTCWCAMKSRCTNPNQPHFERYGGRGI